MKVAIAYSFGSGKTAKVGEKVIEALGNKSIKKIDITTAKGSDLAGFDLLILGAATWFDGELPHYWDEMVPELEQIDFSKTKVAIYGLGNQKNYSENFVDSIGIISEIFVAQGAQIIGSTSTEGYTFDGSYGLVDGRFNGLAIDVENQSGLTQERIDNWVAELKK